MIPVDVRLDDDHVYAPDLLWFSSGHVPVGDVPYVDGPPDLAVEVRSPSTWSHLDGSHLDGFTLDVVELFDR